MYINEIKEIFFNELDNRYPKSEIESFFYLLAEAYIQLKRVDIALEPGYKIESTIQQKFTSALAKLKKEIPIQYIIGETEFYGLVFKVNSHVLIPRPETEELIEWIIQEINRKKLNDKNDLTILDIGTGSGCIAISLAKKLPNAKILALDVSKEAIEIAKINSKLNHVNILFLHENILKVEKLPLKFDLIVSNPPYVRELEKKEIKKNVLENEPHLALFVKDKNPLLFYDKIADFAKNNLKNKGKLYFEINQYLGKETLTLLKEKGFEQIKLRKDIYGNDRMLAASYFF